MHFWKDIIININEEQPKSVVHVHKMNPGFVFLFADTSTIYISYMHYRPLHYTLLGLVIYLSTCFMPRSEKLSHNISMCLDKCPVNYNSIMSNNFMLLPKDQWSLLLDHHERVLCIHCPDMIHIWLIRASFVLVTLFLT